MSKLAKLITEIEACRLCAAHLVDGVRPVVRAEHAAKVMIIGQAPGRKVHETGIPWNDPSGDRLRDWLQVDKATFYDTSKIAIMPMGFCFPGTGKSGDLPPRPECAPTWHQRMLAELPNIELTLLIGNYAQQAYLSDKSKTLTETVKQWQQWWPERIALPHPSPRNQIWLKKNPWFGESVIPALRQQVHAVLNK